MPAKKPTKRKSAKKISFTPSKKQLTSKKGLLFIAAFVLIGGFLAFRAFASPVVEHFEGQLGGPAGGTTTKTITLNMNNAPWLVSLQSNHPDLTMKLVSSKGNTIFDVPASQAAYGRWQLPDRKWSWKSAFYGITPDTYTLTITDTKPADTSNYIVSFGYDKNIPPPPTGGQFYEDFSSTTALKDRFDFGWSGVNPVDVGSSISTFKGDHDSNCGPPTSLRDVHLKGTGPNMDFSEAFWQCNPGGDPAKGHLMTGVNTFGYNHAWFSPKQTFTNIHKVCWDINETAMSSRKWTEVQFVGVADAHKYPTGTMVDSGVWARGTGGFDLGYTDIGFRGGTGSGPTTGLVPTGGDLAGLKDFREVFSYFQNGVDGVADQVNWPGTLSSTSTDKATRYKHCLTDNRNGTLTLENAMADGTHTNTFKGTIPQDATRVVFHDSVYDAPKGDHYDPNFLTWHWDNIYVE